MTALPNMTAPNQFNWDRYEWDTKSTLETDMIETLKPESSLISVSLWLVWRSHIRRPSINVVDEINRSWILEFIWTKGELQGHYSKILFNTRLFPYHICWMNCLTAVINYEKRFEKWKNSDEKVQSEKLRIAIFQNRKGSMYRDIRNKASIHMNSL